MQQTAASARSAYPLNSGHAATAFSCQQRSQERAVEWRLP